MVPSIFEKFSYGIALLVLYSQAHLPASDLVWGGIDLLLGVLFVVAFLTTRDQSVS